MNIAIVATSSLLVCVVASADAVARPLLISAEAGSWQDTVSALQIDPNSQGRVVHLAVVGDRGDRLPCDQVELALDDNARAAFVLGACDPRVRSFPLRVMNRAAMFDAQSSGSQPLALGITAREVHAIRELSDTRAIDATVVHCSVDVHPAVMDLVHNTSVALTPDRYVLRPMHANVVASPTQPGWRLEGTGHARIEAAYEIVERASQRVILRERATLACGAEPVGAVSPSERCGEIPELPSRTTIHNDVRSALDANPNSRGRLYRFTLAARSEVQIALSATDPGDVPDRVLFSGCNPQPQTAIAGPSPYVLQPGTYTVLVSRSPQSHGAAEFNLTMNVDAIGPIDRSLPELRFDEPANVMLEPGRQGTRVRMRAHLDRPTSVRLWLESTDGYPPSGWNAHIWLDCPTEVPGIGPDEVALAFAELRGGWSDSRTLQAGDYWIIIEGDYRADDGPSGARPLPVRVHMASAVSER